MTETTTDTEHVIDKIVQLTQIVGQAMEESPAAPDIALAVWAAGWRPNGPKGHGGMVDEDDTAYEAWHKAEREGALLGHEHCPDCGCNPADHTEHADGCRRIGTSVALQCGPPWNPWPDDPALAAALGVSS